jgi:hypothetical protein
VGRARVPAPSGRLSREGGFRKPRPYVRIVSDPARSQTSAQLSLFVGSEVSMTLHDADIIVPSPSQQVRLFFGGDDTLVR